MASGSNSKRAATGRLKQLARELGLTTSGGLFRQTSAAGEVDGSNVTLELTQDRQAIGEGRVYMHGGPGYFGDQFGLRATDGVQRGEAQWGTAVRTTHDSLGCDITIVPSNEAPEERAGDRIVLTGDDAFDSAIKVQATDANRALALLDEEIRATLVAFYEAGSWAVIKDDEIQLASALPVRALAPHVRNAAKMSRVLGARSAELGA